MKRIFTTFILIAAAALTFSSCEREEIANTESDSAITLHITASTIDTKTVFGDRVDGAYSVKWTADKQVAFSLNETTLVGVTPVVINEGAGASFDVTFTEGGEIGTVYAFSPKGVYDSKNPENNQPGFTRVNSAYHDVYLNIPNVQTPLANSCDESAQALFASQEFNGADTEINMTFNHVVAYGKMAIKNFTGTIAKVDVVFPEPVCGTSCYYYYDGDDKGKVKNADVKNITLNPDNVVGNVFWFACAPTAGDTGSMKFIITDSDDKTYTKTINLTAKALPFTQGKVSSFGVDMSGISADENNQVIPDGSYAILAKRTTGNNYFYMTSDLGSASTKRYQAVDSGLSSLPASLEVNEEQIWTVTNSADGMIISANTGKQITWKSDNSGDLADTGKKLSAKESETTGAFNISIVETSDRILALNTSNPYFAFYKGSGVKDLFFVPATVSGSISYNLSVSPTSITGLEAINASKKITVTTNTTDWKATTSDNWISISISGNIVTLTLSDNVADKQSTSERTGKVTISSIMANTSIDVSVTQNGKEYVDPSTSTVYSLVSDLSTLSSDDVIVLGCAAKGTAAGAMGTGAYFTSVDATIKDGKLTSSDAIEITLGGSAGAWTLTTSEGQITTSAAKALKLNTGTQKTWTISISDGTATITGGSYGSIQYNASSPRFCNYTSNQTGIEIYKK